MPKANGQLIISDPYVAGPAEFDTFTCSHCNCIVVIDKAKPNTLGGFCRMCMRNICSQCVDAVTKGPTGCVPFEKKMEQLEARARFRKALTE